MLTVQLLFAPQSPFLAPVKLSIADRLSHRAEEGDTHRSIRQHEYSGSHCRFTCASASASASSRCGHSNAGID
jgi:hypothetical protein